MRKLHVCGLRAASLRRRAIVLGCASVFLVIGVQSASAATSASWLFGGNDITNSRTQSAETKISSSTVGQLAVKWTAPTHGDVSATPTVANGVVYFPDWGGYINAVNAETGAVIWSKQLYADYGDPAPAGYPTSINMISRTSPAVYGNKVIFGDNNGGGNSAPGGARVFAVNAQTGDLLWKKTVDTNPVAVVTANPVVAGGKLIIGVSSNEEGIAAGIWGPYACCTFRGKVLSLDPTTGSINWETYTVPSNNPADLDSNAPCTGSDPDPIPPNEGPTGCGYTGGAVWDTPAIDLSTRRIFIGTGNNYTATDAAVACQQENPTATNCAVPDDWFDAVLSLNLDTGAISWGRRVQGWDAWTVACAFGLPPGVTWCPSPQSPDFDFGGSGPNLMPGKGPKGTTLVGIGQKSGIYWAFDAKTGATVWDTLVGPGAALGGIEWGTAYDGGRIYVPLANSDNKQYNLHIDGPSATGGSYAALDPSTGKFDWHVPTPGDGSAWGIGPASAANGVVFVGSSAGTGNNMFALGAGNGKVLWSFPASGSVWSGPAIANGVVYWGSGYGRFAAANTENKFYAFSINGK
jgi:polyvinyl alcohol dehydrogenase (cytochrome)